MKILIIDDSDYKIQHLKRFLVHFKLGKEIRVAKSFQTGIHEIKGFNPDLILLDMTLPTSEKNDGELEGRNRMLGGKEIMAEMMFEDWKAKIIIVTQFDHFGEGANAITLQKLLIQLQKQFPALYAGGIYYDNLNSAWWDSLQQLIHNLYPQTL